MQTRTLGGHCAVCVPALVSALTAAAGAQDYAGQRLISESAYREKIRGMWLGECLANWTGLQTEGRELGPTFLTHDAWGQTRPYTFGFVLDYKWYFNPWGADDDTDLEYTYQHLMVTQNTLFLTPRQIADGWVLHVNRFIFVSNATARALMGRGVLPPSTGLSCANGNRLQIDAQLTTELFGTLAPGNPGRALELADIPIRATSAGYATHAAQFYVVLYSLATQIPPGSPNKQRWLVQEGRKYIPNGSRAAEVIDFVLMNYDQPHTEHAWEATRDAMYQRYHLNPGMNGWVYRNWFESVLNLGTGVLALLYGEGDYKKTVLIGTLSGWDSDNGTATMGSLLGLINGYAWMQTHFLPNTMRENYWISRTRDNLPDYTPPGDGFEDTFPMMADRWMPMVRKSIAEGGGYVDTSAQGSGGLWLVPPVGVGGSAEPPLHFSPTWRADAQSANNQVRRAGGVVSAAFAAGSTNVAPPANRGVATAANFANGLETRFDGAEEDDTTRFYFTSQGKGVASDGTVMLEVTYDRPVTAHTIRFIEGDHFMDGTGNGGWFTTMNYEARIGGVWTPVTGTSNEAQSSARPFQIIDFVLSSPVVATGVRVRGLAGGTSQFVTCGELDAFDIPTPTPRQSFDVNGDGFVSIDDLYAQEKLPRDLDGNGAANEVDLAYLKRALRWNERAGMIAGR